MRSQSFFSHSTQSLHQEAYLPFAVSALNSITTVQNQHTGKMPTFHKRNSHETDQQKEILQQNTGSPVNKAELSVTPASQAEGHNMAWLIFYNEWAAVAWQCLLPLICNKWRENLLLFPLVFLFVLPFFSKSNKNHHMPSALYWSTNEEQTVVPLKAERDPSSVERRCRTSLR